MLGVQLFTEVNGHGGTIKLILMLYQRVMMKMFLHGERDKKLKVK